MALTLQILHTSDFEGGIEAAGTSPQTSDTVGLALTQSDVAIAL
ncbi:MAG: hypothetical protein RMX65_006560 [Nostoc sp. DedQUE01]|nr:hypothetical protein [Nostoc sp. DedQUE01]MDZ8077876.1 hypothetical protein [Nostoc sp. DcaGUA01]